MSYKLNIVQKGVIYDFSCDFHREDLPSLPGLHGKVHRRLCGRGGGGAVANLDRLRGRNLDEEAVVPLVDVFALLDDAEHCLVHLVALNARICVARPARPVSDFLLKFKI